MKTEQPVALTGVEVSPASGSHNPCEKSHSLAPNERLTCRATILEFVNLGTTVFRAKCSIIPKLGSQLVFRLGHGVRDLDAGTQVCGKIDPNQPSFELDFLKEDEVTMRIALIDLCSLSTD